ncbi:outer membrane beta-barrel protein [Helicobacter sp. 11S02629-2]|uniref:outer membrane beta-barrel protein n=1 Tax=Helicobacter sp. 11S02629-2 TaxID=1476195 RepID=UPI000BA51E96|nr:outer membrane beta-barrel protein [Helicobacter sp. 11S02629-2]PAF46036.1 hypothetical protein BKH40_01115 [Helicobacter sp. 11S02629-2]
MKQKTLLGMLGLIVALSTASFAKDGVFVGINAGLVNSRIDYKKKTSRSFFPVDAPGYSVGLDIGYTQSFTKIMGLRYYVSYNFSQSFGEKSAFTPDNGSTTMYNNGALILNHMILANVDYFIKLDSMFELYAGFGLGYSHFTANLLQAKVDPKTGYIIMSTNSSSEEAFPNGKPDTYFNEGASFVLPINVGLSINITEHQSLRMGLKIPLIATDFAAMGLNIPLLSQAEADMIAPPKGEIQGSIKNFIAQIGYSYTF